MKPFNAISSLFNTKYSNACHLSLLCTNEGLSLCIYDTQLNIYVALKHILFTKVINDYSDLNKAINAVCSSEYLLQLPYKKIRCIYPTQCCTLLPHGWAQPEQFKQQLEFNHPLHDLDEVHYCHIREAKTDCVFTVPGPLSAKLFDQMGQITYVHQSVPLIHNLWQWQNAGEVALFTVNIQQQFADIAFCLDSKFKIYNTFVITSAQDLIYFIMLIAHQYNIQKSQASILISGDIDNYTDELHNFFDDIFRVKVSQSYCPPEIEPYLHPYFDLLFSLEQCT